MQSAGSPHPLEELVPRYRDGRRWRPARDRGHPVRAVPTQSDRADRRSLAGMSGFIVLLHVVGFGVLFGLVVPQHYHARRRPPGLHGRGRRARLHVRAAARLRRRPHRRRRQHHPQAARRQRPRTARRRTTAVGRVLVLARPLDDRVRAWRSCSRSASRPSPGRSRTTARSCTRSPASSARRCPGVFLWILGILNLVVLLGILRVFREMRSGRLRRAASSRSSSTSAAS